jgi:hypothetical protein
LDGFIDVAQGDHYQDPLSSSRTRASAPARQDGAAETHATFQEPGAF